MNEARLRELLAGATPGPWRVESSDDPDSYLAGVVKGWREWIAAGDCDDPGLDSIPSWIVSPRTLDLEDDGGYMPKADAELAVAAVNSLPKLLAVVEAARAFWSVESLASSVHASEKRRSRLRLAAALAALDEGERGAK